MVENYMGIDPSTVCSGYGIINTNEVLISNGKVRPDKKRMTESEQGFFQYSQFKKYALEHDVKGIFCEDQYSGPNADTFKKLCHVTGMLMALAGELGIPFRLFAPGEWRKLALDKGNATKDMCREAMNEKYGLSMIKKDNDMAEGIGIALAGIRELFGGAEDGNHNEAAC